MDGVYVQGFSIQLSVDSRDRSYIPDGIAVRHGRAEVHEVKPDADAATDEVRALTIAAACHLTLRGATYGFALASSLKAVPVYANMQDVLRRLHRRVPDALARRFVAEAQDAGPLPVAVLARMVTHLGGAPEDILALVARGRLRMDLERSVTIKAPVWAPEAFPNPAPILLPPIAPGRLP